MRQYERGEYVRWRAMPHDTIIICGKGPIFGKLTYDGLVVKGPHRGEATMMMPPAELEPTTLQAR